MTAKNTFNINLEANEENASTRDVMRRCAFEEVTMYTQSMPEEFPGLIHPSELGDSFSRALEPSGSIGYFILVDDHQVESLDEIVQVNVNTQVDLVRVVQLRDT